MSITDLPDGVTNAGLEFNYNVWTPGTSVMLTNVPWGNDYKDVVKFANSEARENYLTRYDSRSITIRNMTYAKFGAPVRIDLPFSTVQRFNYLRVKNPMLPPAVGQDQPREFFYFISDVRYIAPNTTEIVVQLDVFQTFMDACTLGQAYIERGHIGIANNDQFRDYGRWYLTTPEGFDIGGEYQVNGIYTNVIASVSTQAMPGDVDTSTYGYQIVVATNIDITKGWGTPEDPKLQPTAYLNNSHLPNSTHFYLFDRGPNFTKFMQLLSTYSWISQGIIGVWIIPQGLNLETQNLLFTYDDTSFYCDRILGVKQSKRIRVGKREWRNDYPLPERYRHLYKFLTYPYTVVEMTTYNGNPLVLKPESIQHSDLLATQISHVVYPNPRITFVPQDYNTGFAPTLVWPDGIYRDGGEWLDMQTGIMNLPQFSVVNNSYTAYLAANTHSIAYQHSALDWSQQRAMAGNQLAYNQASASMGLANVMTNIGVNQANQSMNLSNQTSTYRGVQSGANSALGGIASMLGGNVVGGLVSAATGVANAAATAAIDINQTTQQTGINNAASMAANRASVANMGYVRDTNKDYADWAAKGDYSNGIAAINAKVQDAKLMQPTTSGQIGGDAFNLATMRWELTWKVKQLTQVAYETIGEYWLRYGYAVNRWTTIPKSLMVMDRMTYWKCAEVYIRSAYCPETFKQTIRGIFEKGVTVWADPNDIGFFDLGENEPLEGVFI